MMKCTFYGVIFLVYYIPQLGQKCVLCALPSQSYTNEGVLEDKLIYFMTEYALFVRMPRITHDYYMYYNLHVLQASMLCFR